MTALYYSMSEWARCIGVSRERARQILNRGDVPSAIKIITSKKSDTWAIPVDTPKPETKRFPGRKKALSIEPILPLGMISIRQWAFMHNRTVDAARAHVDGGRVQAEIISHTVCVRHDTPWPIKKKWSRKNSPKPRKVCPFCNRTMVKLEKHLWEKHSEKMSGQSVSIESSQQHPEAARSFLSLPSTPRKESEP